MTPRIRMCLSGGVFAAALLCSTMAGAQQQPAAAQATIAYDLKRETVVQGTVLSYTASSTTAPIGPHATIETSSGTVDVHLGNAERMKINDIFLAVGDSVKIVGETHNYGTGDVFLARVLRKGTQVVTLRSLNGIPLAAGREGAGKTRSIARGAQ